LTEFLVKNDYLNSEKRTRCIVRVEKMIILDSDQTTVLLVLENIINKNGRNVLTAKSK